MGESIELELTCDPHRAMPKSVSWSSSTPSVVTVDADGEATGVSAGTATITASAGHLSASAKVTVHPVNAQSIRLDKTSLTLSKGEVYTLQATVSPANASVHWQSSDESVVTVKDGVITAVRGGYAKVVLFSGNVSAECAVKVHVPVTGIAMEPASLILPVDDSFNVTVVLEPEDATPEKLVWTSSAPSVASVETDGKVAKVTGLKPGFSYITVTADSFRAVCQVNVMVGSKTIVVPTGGFKIASYNMRVITGSDTGDKAFSVRKDVIFRRIRSCDWDIFGTQEVNDKMREELDQGLAGTYVSFGCGRNSDRKGEGTPIYYKPDRFTLLEDGAFWLSETPDVAGSKGWDASLPRVAVWGRFEDKQTGKKFLYINTHFDHKGSTNRLESARLLVQKAQEIGGGLPMFFTGDLNSTPTSDQVKYLSSGNDLVKNAFFATTNHKGREYTYYGYNLDTTSGSHIDYIFVPKQAAVNSYWCIDDDMEERIYSSDHFPIMAVVTLP